MPNRRIEHGWPALSLAWLALVGCAAAPASSENPLEVDAREYSRLFRAAVEVLRDGGPAIDRQDYRFGTITAATRDAATVFEFWRGEGATLAQTLEATVNHRRRRVTVQFEPTGAASADAAEPRAYLLYIEVMIEQFEVPTRQMTGSTAGWRVFGSLHAVPAELRERGIAASYWRPVTRDVRMEARLQRAILRRSLSLPENR